MTSFEEKPKNDESKLRPNVESLSDLIFGLALSIGAIALIGQEQQSAYQVYFSLVVFGFGFYILINVWYNYSRVVKALPFETSRLIVLNIVLLFLVSIEPFLLNLLFQARTTSTGLGDIVSTLYGLDLGGMYLIIAYFFHQTVAEERKLVPPKLMGRYKRTRDGLSIDAAIFFVSTLPFFYIYPFQSYIALREIIWLSTFLILPIFRVYERQASTTAVPKTIVTNEDKG